MQAAFVSGAPLTTARLSNGQLGVTAFRSALPAVPVRARRCAASVNMKVVLPMFTEAMEDYAKNYPEFAKKGWGCTVKAERWNGRHAQLGMLAILITGYCKGHGLLPPAEALDLSVWGPLASLGDSYSGITGQRAAILIAHVHLLFVSVGCALAPLSFQDKLLLEDGENDEEPAGLFPPFNPGFNLDTELWNGRVVSLLYPCFLRRSQNFGSH